MFKLNLPASKVTYKLPDILSANEIQQIIKAVDNIKYRTLLMVICSAGLRVSEAINLRIFDIDSDRMTLHIRCAKGGKDRYVILSPVVYQALRKYWKACKFKDYVFPSRKNANKPLSTHRALQIFKAAKRIPHDNTCELMWHFFSQASQKTFLYNSMLMIFIQFA